VDTKRIETSGHRPRCAYQIMFCLSEQHPGMPGTESQVPRVVKTVIVSTRVLRVINPDLSPPFDGWWLGRYHWEQLLVGNIPVFRYEQGTFFATYARQHPDHARPMFSAVFATHPSCVILSWACSSCIEQDRVRCLSSIQLSSQNTGRSIMRLVSTSSNDLLDIVRMAT
jgi:hypothetical protein